MHTILSTYYLTSENIKIFFFYFILYLSGREIFLADSISLTVCKPSLHRTLYSFTISSWKWIGLQRRIKLHWSAVMTLRFLESLCFWHRIMRDVTFFTRFLFRAANSKRNKFDCVCRVVHRTFDRTGGAKGEKIYFEYARWNAFGKAYSLLCNCVLILFNSVNRYMNVSVISAGKTDCRRNLFSLLHRMRIILFYHIRNIRSLRITEVNFFFFLQRCKRVWFISSCYNGEIFTLWDKLVTLYERVYRSASRYNA